MPDIWPETEPREVELTAGDASLAIDLRGATLRRLTVGGWEVFDGYPPGGTLPGRRGGVLLPWPNRIRDGRWTWEGEELQLEVVSPGSPVAQHGLVTWQPWTVLAATGDTATVGTTVLPRPGYPFRLAAAVDHVLAPDRLTVTLRVRNDGDRRAPFGAGFHPYFAVGATADGDVGEAEVELPGRTELLVEGGLPSGGRRPFDGAVGRIGERAFDTPLTDLVRDDDGWARARLRGPAGRLELAVDEAWPWLLVYSGDQLPEGQRRRSLALEPMSCPSNALADDVDVVVLEPGETWAGSWSVAWTPAV
jgi:aldose 1-epimerase